MPYDATVLGSIHSIYTGGMVDGPGIRTVVFLAGCSLRCLYCHNPDTWFSIRGNKKTVGEILEEARKYTSYYEFSGGGITVSGGEPADQPFFLQELLKACRENNIHTVLDTSGCATTEIAEEILPHVDLLMLDFKAFDAELYFKITQQDVSRPINTLKVAEKLNIPTWIRFVLVPNLTDDLGDIRKMTKFLKQHKNIEKIDVLPFHKHGEYKWHELNFKYELKNIQPPTPESIRDAEEIFKGAL
jgi:pyruvate formate lyase activating enzyme